MFANKYYQSSISALVAITVGSSLILPVFNSTSAFAYSLPKPKKVLAQFNLYQIPRGTQIPVSYEKDKILVAKTETVPVTLTVAANIRNRNQEILVPAGSEIVGEIKPANKGSRFVAKKLIINDGNNYKELSFNANSKIVTTTEVIDQGADTGSILEGAAIGAAAATVISAITGDNAIATEEVLGGAGLGALAGWLLGGSSAELISINPDTDLTLTVNSDLTVR